MRKNEFGLNNPLHLFNLYYTGKKRKKQNAVDRDGNMIPEMFVYLHFYQFIMK